MTALSAPLRSAKGKDAVRVARARSAFPGNIDVLGLVAGGFLLLMTVAAAAASAIAPYGINDLVGPRLQTPSWRFLLGTDELGRDLLSRVLFGARASLLIGFTASVFGTTVGALLGLIGGYLGGRLDSLLQRVMETIMAFPLLVMALALLGTTETPTPYHLIAAIVVVVFPRTARVIRGVTLTLRGQDYILAARAVGASPTRIMFGHLLPNVMPYAIVLVTIVLGNAILVEAALSFLGYGVQPPTPSWGAMLSGSVRAYMFQAPWLVIPPGLALSLTVFAANLFGDALRDALDPRLRRA